MMLESKNWCLEPEIVFCVAIYPRWCYTTLSCHRFDKCCINDNLYSFSFHLFPIFKLSYVLVPEHHDLALELCDFGSMNQMQKIKRLSVNCWISCDILICKLNDCSTSQGQFLLLHVRPQLMHDELGIMWLLLLTQNSSKCHSLCKCHPDVADRKDDQQKLDIDP